MAAFLHFILVMSHEHEQAFLHFILFIYQPVAFSRQYYNFISIFAMNPKPGHQIPMNPGHQIEFAMNQGIKFRE
jgi:hypothetical protein